MEGVEAVGDVFAATRQQLAVLTDATKPLADLAIYQGLPMWSRPASIR
ncbi:MAG: hypothetical protein KDB37_03785 [Ilumatobacter sp.]|nr:hypothetical protein [Ilumatobacter sp.]